ncbi:MAG: hypothetical protein ACOX7N_03520 [Lawsonibacter sp.]|jgi:hypothetical protein
MRSLSCQVAVDCPPAQKPRLARLTRHLNARLLDFGPGGPQISSSDEDTGRVAVRFPGHDTQQVRKDLATRRIFTAQEDDCAVFFLAPNTQFEDLDYLWGCLYDILT